MVSHLYKVTKIISTKDQNQQTGTRTHLIRNSDRTFCLMSRNVQFMRNKKETATSSTMTSCVVSSLDNNNLVRHHDSASSFTVNGPKGARMQRGGSDGR